MMNKPSRSLAIIGAGGHGKVIADCAHAMQEFKDIVFLDDNFPNKTENLDWPVIDKSSQWSSYLDQYEFVIAIGDNVGRLKLYNQLAFAGAKLPNIIHPCAVISSFSTMGSGNVVFANAVINPEAVIANACIINTAATIDHDCQLSNAVHISPGAHLAGNVIVHQCVWFGIGSCSLQNIIIEENCQIGAGATVVKSTEANGLYLGTPAKLVKEINY
jgi:sugar O-acyltransferase (sialic acid O-acetyltransferase NeuD family)